MDAELTLHDIHNEAMDIVEWAVILTHKYHAPLVAMMLFREAYPLERASADRLTAGIEHEPSRSILYSSAGAIAVNAGFYQEALDCAEKGLESAIHGYVIGNLKDVLEKAYKGLRDGT